MRRIPRYSTTRPAWDRVEFGRQHPSQHRSSLEWQHASYYQATWCSMFQVRESCWRSSTIDPCWYRRSRYRSKCTEYMSCCVASYHLKCINRLSIVPDICRTRKCCCLRRPLGTTTRDWKTAAAAATLVSMHVAPETRVKLKRYPIQWSTSRIRDGERNLIVVSDLGGRRHLELQVLNLVVEVDCILSRLLRKTRVLW